MYIGIPSEKSVVQNPPLTQDITSILPDPFNLSDWIEKHITQLNNVYIYTIHLF